jgi:hypothetical protein
LAALTKLSLTGCDLADDALAQLADHLLPHTPKLTALDLSGNPFITDDALAAAVRTALSTCVGLRSLQLDGTAHRDKTLATVVEHAVTEPVATASHTQLSVSLQRANLSAGSVASIVALAACKPQLRRALALNLQGCAAADRGLARDIIRSLVDTLAEGKYAPLEVTVSYEQQQQQQPVAGTIDGALALGAYALFSADRDNSGLAIGLGVPHWLRLVELAGLPLQEWPPSAEDVVDARRWAAHKAALARAAQERAVQQQQAAAGAGGFPGPQPPLGVASAGAASGSTLASLLERGSRWGGNPFLAAAASRNAAPAARDESTGAAPAPPADISGFTFMPATFSLPVENMGST